MPEQETLRRADRDKKQGKAPTTQAGEFIREEMDHIREGKHGARSTKQAIAIGLSKAQTSRSETSATEEGSGFGKNSPKRRVGLSRGAKRSSPQDQRQAIASDHAGFEA